MAVAEPHCVPISHRCWLRPMANGKLTNGRAALHWHLLSPPTTTTTKKIFTLTLRFLRRKHSNFGLFDRKLQVLAAAVEIPTTLGQTRERDREERELEWEMVAIFIRRISA